MKVKISYTVTVTDEERLALGHYFDQDRPANRAEITEYFLSHGFDTDLKALVRDYYTALSVKYSELAGGK